MPTGMQLGGKAVICCIHGRVKREIDAVPISEIHRAVVQCMCCENVFASTSSEENQLCTSCSPKIVEGIDRIG